MTTATISLWLATLCAAAPTPPNRVTILYDAFGKPSALKRDWGFSALIEYGGKRVLFDAGNLPDVFAANIKTLGVDLGKIDVAVVSHRHTDHTAGLTQLAQANPKIKIYAPADEQFGGMTPPAYYKQADAPLPPEMRYFGGTLPAHVPHGTRFGDIAFVLVQDPIEIAPGMRVIPTVSENKGTVELPELSLSISTPKGQVLVVGCSHPGIERILDAATKVDKRVHLVFGGFHLAPRSEAEIDQTVKALREKYKLERIAPGHCTGEVAFAKLRNAFGKDYLFAGLGSEVELP